MEFRLRDIASTFLHIRSLLVSSRLSLLLRWYCLWDLSPPTPWSLSFPRHRMELSLNSLHLSGLLAFPLHPLSRMISSDDWVAFPEVFIHGSLEYSPPVKFFLRYVTSICSPHNSSCPCLLLHRGCLWGVSLSWSSSYVDSLRLSGFLGTSFFFHWLLIWSSFLPLNVLCPYQICCLSTPCLVRSTVLLVSLPNSLCST